MEQKKIILMIKRKRKRTEGSHKDESVWTEWSDKCQASQRNQLVVCYLTSQNRVHMSD